MQLKLPYEFDLRHYQQPLWDAVVIRNVDRALTVWPRRNGKDLTAVNILVAKAVQRRGLYLYIGPYHNQIRQIIWQGATGDPENPRKFLDYIPPEIVVRKRDSVMEIDLVNGSVIKLVGSDNIDSIVGTNPVGVIYTEMSLQKVEAWEYIRPILSENGGWAIFNGTPRGMNHFFKMARMAKDNPDWFYQYLTRDDTGVPTLEAIDKERRAGMRESMIEQEYYCSWEASEEEVYIPLDVVMPAVDYHLEPQEYSFAPRVMGCDVAYAAKGDQAVICKRQGRLVHEFMSYQGHDNMAFAASIAREIRTFRPRYVFIDGGRGEGVISRLHQMGHRDIVIPVYFNGKTYDPLYSNMVAQMWGRARDWFMTENRPHIPYHEAFIENVTNRYFDHNEKQELVIEPKKQAKTRGFTKWDEVDAFLLTFAEEIEEEPAPNPHQASLGITQEMLHNLEQRSYNPLHHCDSMYENLVDDHDKIW